ncbi:MAG: response regulator transcription factor [Acidimicrobiales bacterium]
MATRILMIEDEPVFSDFVTGYFGREGYEVQVAPTGEEGLAALDADPDVIILDLNLPDMDGFDICRQIRSKTSTPLIILSGRSDETDKVLGLELGADDYATKPFSPRELLARVRALLRRSGENDVDAVTHVGEYEFDTRKREVRANGEQIGLTVLEFDLLAYLVQNRNTALGRDQIFESVWNEEFRGRSRTVDTHMANLRAKLPGIPVTTMRGVGYRLDLG